MSAVTELAPGGTAGELRSVRASDGVELRYRRFAPADGAERGSVVHLHGIQSHGGWYVETAAELADRGYAVSLVDRRGSGLSSARRGDFARASQLVDDVARIVDEAARLDGGRPPVLVGGCWGARPAVAFAASAGDRLSGLVLVAPALKSTVDLTSQQKLQVFLGRLLAPLSRIPIPLTPELFTDNQPYLDFVRRDPLSLHDVTARFFFQQFFWDRQLLAQRELPVPLLLMQPSPDPVVDVPAVREWYERLVVPSKRYLRYEGFGHILDFAPERARFWSDLAEWLDTVSG
jgi:alpha-beta hydrolase superfamily lysophospholipase